MEEEKEPQASGKPGMVKFNQNPKQAKAAGGIWENAQISAKDRVIQKRRERKQRRKQERKRQKLLNRENEINKQLEKKKKIKLSNKEKDDLFFVCKWLVGVMLCCLVNEYCQVIMPMIREWKDELRQAIRYRDQKACEYWQERLEKFNEAYKQHQQQAIDIKSEINESNSNNNTIDLHSLTKDEALILLQTKVAEKVSNLILANFRDLFLSS